MRKYQDREQNDFSLHLFRQVLGIHHSLDMLHSAKRNCWCKLKGGVFMLFFKQSLRTLFIVIYIIHVYFTFPSRQRRSKGNHHLCWCYKTAETTGQFLVVGVLAQSLQNEELTCSPPACQFSSQPSIPPEYS